MILKNCKSLQFGLRIKAKPGFTRIVKFNINTNIIKRLPCFLAAILFSGVSFAQDIQFSQFYNASLYQNPAFAGAAHNPRFSANQRIQWPGLKAKYLTSMVAFDTYSNKYRSGFGFMAFKDWQGASTINSTDIALQYSYELHLSSGVTFRPGLQVSYVNRTLNYEGLTMPENFDNTGQVSAPTFQAGQNRQYMDISSGGILYNNRMWIGFSAHHINTPNQSYVNSVSELPVKYAVTGGYKITYKKSLYHHVDYLEDDGEYSITPTFHYKTQGRSDQLDLGVYGIYDNLILGAWFRGIPVKRYSKDYSNNESLILLAGWKYQQLSFAYSYDFTVSKLVRAGTGGSHEISVSYVVKRHKRHKPMRRLPCPNFNHR